MATFNANRGPMMVIDGEWYDLEKWAKYHPGGIHILRQYDGVDATDAFYSLHSDAAIKKLKSMRPVEAKELPPLVEPLDESFREFRAKLMKDGWFEREWLHEARLLLSLFTMVVVGTYYAWTYPLLSILILGVAMQQAGWLGHDMTHARNSTYCDTMLVPVSDFINGFNREWWSRKHNTHHVMTNHVGVDPDIDLMPMLFLWAPTKSVDTHLRKYQHYYFLPLYSLLYISWRTQSIQRAIHDRDFMQLVRFIPGYTWLYILPLQVSIGSVLLGGLLVALVVTQSHEMEEMVHDNKPRSFALTQFEGTRDIDCPDPVTEYLFGGMQYQLVHHLFPTLPRYKYRRLQPLVSAWASANSIKYKRSSLTEVFSDHIEMLKRNGKLAAKEDSEKTPQPGWSVSLQTVA